MSNKVLSEVPLCVSSINYDFESYALKFGIPETLDPLPYRKAGSVFGGATTHTDENLADEAGKKLAEEEESRMTSAKHDPRLRTVVCRHWLRDLCMKGAACEFLHQYDLSKMPLCRHGEKCKIKDCPFRHISEADRLECVFYSQGFCIHGPYCRYKHVRRERADLPVVADFTLGLSQMQAGKDSSNQVSRRPAPKPNEFYKVSLCKHFLSGECPFGENCHFAHGEHELKKFPRPGQNEEENDDDNNNEELSDNMFEAQTTKESTTDYFQGGASGGGKPCPIIEPEDAAFFIVRAATQHDLAHSAQRGEWWVQAKHAALLNEKLNKGKQVMIFFTVSNSEHIQGAALLTSTVADYSSSTSTKPNSKKRKRKDEPFDHYFTCEWYRIVELPYRTALEAAPDLLLPTSSTQFCQDMSPKTGEALMKALWNAPLVTLYESFSGNESPPETDAIMTDIRVPNSEETCWPTMPGPGFIFGCNSQTMDECLGRGIFGLPAHMKAAASCIKPGSPIFLFNVSDRLLFGIFEALTPAKMNIEPTAFSKNPNATSSPFPIQIRVQVALECPPLDDNDEILSQILRMRTGGRIGPLTHSQAEAVASLLASQCEALSYLVQYKNGLRQGLHIAPPPIALPPKRISSKPRQQ